jgi:hypothetical protein
MSQKDLTAREAEVIRILKVLGVKNSGFVVIGGYAINALTSHRFSVDCDIVTDSKRIKEISETLVGEGYKTLSKVRKQPSHRVKMKKYVRPVGTRNVSVEVFLNKVSCRQTEGTWSFESIMQNSTKLRVVGLTDSAHVLVPKKELLMAMKIHAGRDTDLRDVVMLSERADWKAVKEFASCGSSDKVKKQIESAISTVSKQEFASALKAEFGLRQDVSSIIKRTLDGLEKLQSH